MSSTTLVTSTAEPATSSVRTRSPLDRLLARKWVLFGVLIALNVADIVLTQVGLDRGAVERNPLMVGAVQSWGGAVAAKAVCLGAAAVVLVSGPRRSRVLDLGLLACVCWYVGVVCWNLNVISNQG